MSKEISAPRYFVCGGFGGICTVLVGHPFDTVKVRLQTMQVSPGQPPPFTGTWDCLTKTVTNEGVRGLYKGMGAPLTGVAPIFAISFFGFGVGKRLFSSTERANMLQTFAAGAFAAIFTTTVMAPGERIKGLLQVQQGKDKQKYNGPIDVVKQLYREGGVRSIFKGSVATLMRDIPASGLYFLAYDVVTSALTPPGENPSIFVTIFGGGMAGVAHWLVGMPADVLKSRLQTAPEGTYPNGLKDVFRQLMVKEGPFALYRGLIPVMLRAFPANAACFVGFETCRRFLSYILPE